VANETELSEVLSEFARTMVTDFPVQAILDRFVQRIVQIMPVSAAGVTLISPHSRPRYVAASSESALRFESLQTELGEGPCLMAYDTGDLVAVPDLGDQDDFPVFGPLAVAAGLGAVFTFPLRQGSRLLGALDLYRDTPGLMSDKDLSVAETLADVTSAYLVNAQSRADLEDSSNRSYENSVHDALTGLPNRLLLMERLEHALQRNRRTGKLVAVLFADIDKFKAVNDHHGHNIGDELLVAASNRLSALIRQGDTLARLAGDEFVLLCEDLDSRAQAEEIATRVVHAFNTPFVFADFQVETSASVGVAFTGSGENLPEMLLRDADMAMYQAKRTGGRHHQIIDLYAQQLAERRSALQVDLRGALLRRELRVDYQPIMHGHENRIVALEALLRWDHPARGPVPPATLIPMAEASGAIIEIGRWVLETACIDRIRWANQTGHDLIVAVNVSPHQLMVSGFIDIVAGVLADTQTPAHLLTLEITESAFIQASDRARVVLGDLKEMGVTLALDDFGTGYSSLDYLRRFPIDVLKIDQRFVSDLPGNRASHSIVSAVINLAHELGLVVVSEGIETIEQYLALMALGSDSIQGFLLARPMSVERVELLLHDAAFRHDGQLILPSPGKLVDLTSPKDLVD
jgi:diguanylate cyclase (GGDEF)-like protein